METILRQQLKKQKENNPHARMHKIVFRIVVLCLTMQVLEGSFIIPYILIHFGYPTLSLKEVCDEMYFIVYKDDERECNFPYPLFAGPEVWKYKDMTDVIGKPVPPRPRYEGFGFRETVKNHEERMARKAAEAEKQKTSTEENIQAPQANNTSTGETLSSGTIYYGAPPEQGINTTDKSDKDRIAAIAPQSDVGTEGN